MNDLKKGDIITDNNKNVREEVLAVLEDLVFTRVVYPNGTFGPAMGPTHIDDIKARGFDKEKEL